MQEYFKDRLGWIVLLSGFMHKDYGYPLENEYYLSSVAVYDKYRNKGIAKKLLEYIIENHNQDISLDIDSANKTAFNLYKSIGFCIQEEYDQFFRSKIYRMIYKQGEINE